MLLAALALSGCYSDAVPLFSDYDSAHLDAGLEERVLVSVARAGAVTTGSPCRDLLDPEVELPAVDFVDGGVQDALTAWARAVDVQRDAVGLAPLEYGDLWLSTFEPGTRPGHPNGQLTRGPGRHSVRLPSAYGVGDFLSVALHEAGHDLDQDHDEVPAVGLAIVAPLAGCGVSQPLAPLVLDDAIDRALSVYYIDDLADLHTEDGRYVYARLVALHLVAERGPTEALEAIHASSADDLAEALGTPIDPGASIEANLEQALEAVAASEAVGAELARCVRADGADEVQSWLRVRVAERRAERDVPDEADREAVEAHLGDPRFTDPYLRYRAEVAWEALEHQGGHSILSQESPSLDMAQEVLRYLSPPCNPSDPASQVAESGWVHPWLCPRSEPSLDAVYAYRVLADHGEPGALDLLRGWAFPDGSATSPWPDHVHNQYVVTVRDLMDTASADHLDLARRVPCADRGLTKFTRAHCEEAKADLSG